MARKKRGAKRKKTSRRRKGAWDTVTYEELDSWRASRKIPKNRMAEMLGVTNSTYHNWARGVSTPTSKTQERIRKVIDGSGREAASPGQGPQLDAAVMEATGMIVEGYLKAKKTRMSTDKLNELIRVVRRALTQ